MEIRAKFNIKFTKTQQKAWNALRKPNIRELVLCQSRQSGKSLFLTFMCIYYLINPDANIGFIAPQFAHCRRVYNHLVKILIPTGLVKSANASILQIEMKNGSMITFYSAESPTALRGCTFRKLVVVDEAAFIPDTIKGEDFFNSIFKPTCKAYKPRIIYASTPLNKGSYFHQKYLEGKAYSRITVDGVEKVNRVHTIEANIYADSLLTDEEIEDIKSSIPDASFRREFMCEFMSDGLSAFNGFGERFILKKQIDFNEPLWGAIDFSSVGDDKTVLTLMNRDYECWQFEVKGSLDSKYQQLANILNKCNKLVICYAETNGVGEPMINSLKKLVKNSGKIVGWSTDNESKENQVSLLQALIDKGLISFEEKNSTLNSEFETFTFVVTKSKHITYGALAGRHDDRVMSLMICVQAREDYVYSAGGNFAFIKSRKI